MFTIQKKIVYLVCPYCETKFQPKRAGQVFCTSAHQKAWHKERAARLEEQLEHERERWRAEREELIREIAALQEARKDA